MAQTSNNPPNDQGAAPRSSALRLARLAIALALAVGIAVFAVLTIEELKAGYKTDAPPSDFGTADGPPAAPPVQANSPNPLAGLTTTDPTKYPLIDRANPHPGEIVPFLRTAPLGQAPYAQSEAGVVWELCVYQQPDASLTDLFAYYSDQAKQKGMRLIKQRPTSDNLPGGIEATWSDGQKRLVVTASPLPARQPVQPPLAPPTPLRWVVKYSYPDPTLAP